MSNFHVNTQITIVICVAVVAAFLDWLSAQRAH